MIVSQEIEKIKLLVKDLEGAINYKPPKIKNRIFSVDHQKIAEKKLKETKAKLSETLWNIVSIVQKKKEFCKLLILFDESEKDDLLENAQRIISFLKGLGVRNGGEDDEFSLSANIPYEISEEINLDFKEMVSCYKNKEYRSASILAGRMLEVILHRKYFEVTKRDILTTNPDIGLGKLISKLMENNVQFDPGITNQIHLLNNMRIHAVHKKQSIFNPSREQAKAIILLTLDVVKKMFP